MSPWPIPTAESWRPADTLKTAQVELQEDFQDTADFAIYNCIVGGPWLLLFGLVGLIGWRTGRRYGWFKQQSS